MYFLSATYSVSGPTSKRVGSWKKVFPRPTDGLPILAVTASMLEGEEQKSRAAGMNDYLVKPIGVSDLVAALERTAAARPPLAAEETDGIFVEVEEPVRAAPPPLPTPPGLDGAAWERLHASLGSRAADLLPGIVRSFVHESDGLLAAARSAAAAERADELHRAVHTLRSTSASFGALDLATLCREAESRAKENETTTLVPLLDRIEGELARARRALESISGEPLPDPRAPDAQAAR